MSLQLSSIHTWHARAQLNALEHFFYFEHGQVLLYEPATTLVKWFKLLNELV